MAKHKSQHTHTRYTHTKLVDMYTEQDLVNNQELFLSRLMNEPIVVRFVSKKIMQQQYDWTILNNIVRLLVHLLAHRLA